MLLEFSVSNFRSIKTLQTLSLVAAPIVSKEKNIDEENVFAASDSINLLKTVAIYGANGSGKSNIVRALVYMLHFIEKSFSEDDFINYVSEPFFLDKTSKNKPIFFQIVFLLGGEQFRYGFELKKGKVISEWLFGHPKKNANWYFLRDLENGIKVNKSSFPEGVGLENGKTKVTTLFLSVVEAFNGKISGEIKTFFKKGISVSSGINDRLFRNKSFAFLDQKKGLDSIVSFLKNADLGITGISKIQIDSEYINNEFKKSSRSPNAEVKKAIEDGKKITVLFSKRTIKNSKGDDIGEVETEFENFESEGTKKLFAYSGVFIEALATGRTLVIDEFDSRLHPSMTKKIVQIFNSKVTNKKNAQLIFVTHDTNLLDSSLMRRDQIYFVEKAKDFSSRFYSLINIGGVRNDASYGKDYIKGKYGAIPFLSNMKIES